MIFLNRRLLLVKASSLRRPLADRSAETLCGTACRRILVGDIRIPAVLDWQ